MDNQRYYRELLEEVLKFKSISTDKQYVDGIESAVLWFESLFKSNGFEVVITRGYGNPIVVAKKIIDGNLPTCLVYGHYDVQPADLSDGWISEPFLLTERDGRLYGRGVVDNKGQVLIHIATVLQLLKENKLNQNVKFMIEGDEETGSPLMEKFVKENKELLRANYSLISDGEMNIDAPVIEAGFRGGLNSTLTIRSAKADQHSGIFGGAIPNSAGIMANVLSRVVDESGKVLVPNFFDKVDPIEGKIKENNESLPFNDGDYMKVAGVNYLTKVDGVDVMSQVGLLPTIQITGLNSGYVGEGYRNSVPSITMAKLNFRLVKSQVPDKIIEQFRKYLEETIPSGVEWKWETTESYEGIKLDLNNEIVRKTDVILSEAYGKKVVYKFSGGGLPIVTLFSQELEMANVLVPLGNEDCGMHSVDENFDLRYLEKALEFSYNFFSISA